MKKKYYVTEMSLEIRLEEAPLTPKEVESRVTGVQERNDQYDCSDSTKEFDNEANARAAMKAAKIKIEDIPCNKKMKVYWAELSVETFDDEGDNLDCETIDAIFPAHAGNSRGIGNAIRVARLQAGMSQTALADAIGSTQSQIGKYERGEQDLTVSRLLDIAEAIGVAPEGLVKGL